MGLVLQAPTDALLPLADATAKTSAPSQMASATDGIFASLLASLSATFGQDTTELAIDSNGLPVAEPPSEGQRERKENDPFAALFAMAVPLPAMPSATAESLVTKTTGADAPPVAALVTELPGSATAAPVTTATEGDAQVEPADGEAPAGEASAIAAPVGAATEPPQESNENAGPILAAALPTESAPFERHTRISETKTPDASPPTEASGAEANVMATSVVRNVGNAESGKGNQDAGKGHGEDHGRKAGIDRPLPQASETGIAHAAANSAVGELRTAQEAAPVDATAAPEAAPAPAAEVPPQVEHVARTVIERVERGGGEARIHLDPAGLGEVTIHVHTQGDHVRLDVRAERHEAAQLLRDHTQDLSTLLGERGLNLSDVNVDSGRGNGDQSWGREEPPQNRPANGEFAGILGVGDNAPLETHNRLRAAYNPDGALMYRV